MRRSLPHGSASKSECSATPAPTVGWATWSRSAYPAVGSSRPSPAARHTIDPGCGTRPGSSSSPGRIASPVADCAAGTTSAYGQPPARAKGSEWSGGLPQAADAERRALPGQRRRTHCGPRARSALVEQFNATSRTSGRSGRSYCASSRQSRRGHGGQAAAAMRLRLPIRIGARCFLNYGTVILDCAPITIGDEVQIASDVQLLAATHPLEAEPRRRAGSPPLRSRWGRRLARRRGDRVPRCLDRREHRGGSRERGDARPAGRGAGGGQPLPRSCASY